MNHEEFEDLAALDAFGASSSDEKAALRQHLAECDRCRAADEEFQQAASLMALGFEPVAPPPELRDRILQAIENEPQDEAPQEDEAMDNEVVPFRRRVRPWWLATAAIFFIALFAWSELRVRAEREKLAATQAAVRTLASENELLARKNALIAAQVAALSASGTRTIGLSGQEVAPAASARVFLDAPQRRAFVFFHNLPPNGEAKSYQLWIIPKNAPAPQSIGVFDVDAAGEASMVIQNLPVATEIKALAVTLEPKGGLKAPSGKMVLMGSSSL
jgi:anti-sigma-K factor RskA